MVLDPQIEFIMFNKF